MIISNSQAQRLIKSETTFYQKNNINDNAVDTNNNAVTAKEDVLDLSDQAQTMRLAKEMILKSPDVRADKVNELKNQIQEGTYRVSPSDIADKMVNRSLVDELVAGS